MISFESKTLQNDKKKFVSLKFNKNNKKFDIKGSSYIGEASTNNVVGNWWNHKILQTNSQISPISGSVKEQIVTFIGKEKIDLYGKTYEVSRFTLKSKDMTITKDKRLNFDIWFDQKNSRILKVTYSKFYIFASLIKGGSTYYWLVVIGGINSVVSLYYNLKVYLLLNILIIFI